MDLLRLVLAKQPVVKLISLPALARNSQFLRVRNNLHGIQKSSTGNLLQDSILAGDLAPEAFQLLQNSHNMNRAIFLGNPGLFLHFARKSSHDLDFWYALGSGVPEIQAHALAWMQLRLENEAVRGQRRGEDFEELLAELVGVVDEGSIPWTPKLKAQLKRIVESFLEEKEVSPFEIPVISGICNIPTAGIQYSQTQLTTYIIARVRSILNYRSSLEFNTEINRLLTSLNVIQLVEMAHPYGEALYVVARTGYYYPLRARLTGSGGLFIMIAAAGLLAMEFDLLFYMAEAGFLRGVTVPAGTPFTVPNMNLPVRLVINIRKCLDDSRIREIMSPEILLAYRAISGEIFDDVVPSPIRMLVANPGQQTGPYPVRGSIQSIVLYDARWLLSPEYEGIPKEYLAARGDLDEEDIQPPGSINLNQFPHFMEQNDPYARFAVSYQDVQDALRVDGYYREILRDLLS